MRLGARRARPIPPTLVPASLGLCRPYSRHAPMQASADRSSELSIRLEVGRVMMVARRPRRRRSKCAAGQRLGIAYADRRGLSASNQLGRPGTLFHAGATRSTARCWSGSTRTTNSGSRLSASMTKYTSSTLAPDERSPIVPCGSPPRFAAPDRPLRKAAMQRGCGGSVRALRFARFPRSAARSRAYHLRWRRSRSGPRPVAAAADRYRLRGAAAALRRKLRLFGR